MPVATESACVILKLLPNPLRPSSAKLGMLAAFSGGLFKELSANTSLPSQNLQQNKTPKGLTLSIFGNNLTDEVARNNSSYVKKEVPLPGRNYGVRFNLTF